MQRILCTWDDFQTFKKVYKIAETPYILGQSSIYVPKNRTKYILQKAAYEWPDLDGVITWMTAGEVARTELKREFPDLDLIGWHRDTIHLLDWRWPLKYGGNIKGELVYIDLKAAYWQLYRRLWLDVGFPGGKGTLRLWDVASRLETNKPARNSLIGVIRSHHTRMVKGRKWKKISTRNQFLSPHLWATIQVILNEIALIAELYGASYIATDGYIFPYNSHWKKFKRFLDNHGLIYRSIMGNGEIAGWGKYSVDSRATVLYTKDKPAGQRKFRSIHCHKDTIKLLTFWKERGYYAEN